MRACVRAVGSVPDSVVCVYYWRCWRVGAYSWVRSSLLVSYKSVGLDFGGDVEEWIDYSVL